jgi:hypothetical protein
MTLPQALGLIQGELAYARAQHPDFHSAHEGYAVILEEVEELWDAIKRDDYTLAGAEAVQVAAMALRFLRQQYTRLTSPILVVSLLMAHPTTRPFVQVASVCEKVLREPDGVFSAIRLVDILTLKTAMLPKPPDLPADAKAVETLQVFNLSLLIVLKSGTLTGEHRLGVAMRDPHNKTVPVGEDLPTVLKGDDGVNLVLSFGMPHNAPAGQYWFDVLWDGELLTSVPLKVTREEVRDESV